MMLESRSEMISVLVEWVPTTQLQGLSALGQCHRDTDQEGGGVTFHSPTRVSVAV